MRIFVGGIGTGVGKTVVAAVLARVLAGDYWKPLQCGTLDGSDCAKIQGLTEGAVRCHPERYRFTSPLAPHAAAAVDGLTLAVSDFDPPCTDSPLVIEGSGGLLARINDRECEADLIRALRCPAILVSRHYLGSINHTLAALRGLRDRGVPLLGIVFAGRELMNTEQLVLNQPGVRLLFRIPEHPGLSTRFVAEAAHELAPHLRELVRDSEIRESAPPPSRM